MAAPIKITRQTQANGAYARWSGVYTSDAYGDDKLVIKRRLAELGERPGPDEVDRVIGNESWTAVPECDGCGKTNARFVVRVGAEPDYESATAHLCGACIVQAAAVARSRA